MKAILSLIGRLVYKCMGWTYDMLPDYWSDRCVVIGFPHTANMDTVRALTYIKIAKVNARLLVKAEWFFFPMSAVLKSLGGIPVKRDKAHGFVESAVREFETRRDLILALVPEGTRKNVTSIKTGFWHIAKGADVPIICWFMDNHSKRTRWLGRIDPGDSLEEDLEKIKSLYEAYGFSIPLGNRV
ncbi:MAG: acyl-phosphate glycerol 3-phosphate acyltransferase [Desulfobacterales bacterium RIFOXYA12_FULL_46_15]|nr:MAG: acyl-phosphate glycerol 3-phosphate acyltransferase [Desulfobacula sp. GWF2_41_7]OGR23285.1 MAG: acyl-phosphate glycerol 3-phosphate acyltransferase [Desulfobacterales bacterium RIFOXYA12_FULL_46_15]